MVMLVFFWNTLFIDHIYIDLDIIYINNFREAFLVII